MGEHGRDFFKNNKKSYRLQTFECSVYQDIFCILNSQFVSAMVEQFCVVVCVIARS